ncbi:ankyrin [Aureobasidium pullulans]|uniref:Ankyrin n=1 Tax=Aureobasidium pullulans TaxID=5580 RepID=A0A4S9GM91_AURPU|nr:ankyrin [Aureobasidium pullulans]THX62547.1 ankyrin [Aureobasidium pullulans]THZ33491.1 ankyrin [Aureobasidium pullulans]
MAELGIASGVAGLLSLVLDVIQVTGKYIQAVSTSNRSVLDVLDTLTSLQAIFIRFKKHVDNTYLSNVISTGPPIISSSTMIACEDRLKRLKTLLESYLNDEGRLKKRHALAWPLRTDQTKDLLVSLERHRDNFHAALSADALDLSLATHAKLLELESDEHLRSVVDWLCPQGITVSPQLESEVDTTHGFCKKPSLLNWMASPGKILWCYGNTGCGKTVLMSLLYREWNQIFTSKRYHIFAYFHDYQEAKQQSADALVRNLLAQIIRERSDVPMEIDKLYTDAKSGIQAPSKTRLRDTLSQSLKTILNVVILIDAFDECQFRADNLSVLRSLAACGASILVTSRKTPDIESLFSKDQQLEIRPDDSDIAKMVDSKLTEIEDDLELDQAFKDDVIGNIVDRCGGIFLLARLIVNDLLRTSSRKELRKALVGLPKTLPEMYRKTMDQIKRSRHADLAMRVVQWVILAARPLRIQELRHGLAVELRTSELDEDNLTSKKTIMSACLGLLTMHTDGFVRCVHASAFEFLAEQDLETTKAGHSDIAGACLTYLSYKVFDEPCQRSEELEDRVATNHFACYAAQNLGFHCRHIETEFTQQFSSLLDNEGSRRSSTQLCYHREIKDKVLRQEAFSMLPNGQTALQVACRLGLIQKSEQMIQSGCDISASDAQGWTALTTASSYGHLHIIRVLVMAGADVNSQDIHGWSPLIWSVLKNNVDVARELPTAGASISLADENGWTAMHWAASIGNLEMIDLLSPAWDRLYESRSTEDYGKAKSKIPDECLEPLLIAADYRNDSALDKMIDVHSNSFRAIEVDRPLDTSGLFRFLNKEEYIARRYNLGRPNLPSLVFPERFSVKLFDSAIRSNHLSMVKLLVERGMKDEMYREVNGRKPLHTAVFCNTPEIPQYLIDHHFDLYAKDAKGYTALDIGLRNGTLEMIEYLLSLPAAKSVIQGSRGSTLHLIWSNQRLLLNHGIESPQSSHQASHMQAWGVRRAWTAEAHARISKAQVTTAKQLLAHGADVNAPNEFGETPIFHALKCSSQAVELLLTHKAKTDILDNDGNSLLHHCIDRDRLNTELRERDGTYIVDHEQDPQLVELLVKYGASPDTVNKYDETPLHLLVTQKATEKQLATLRCLLERCESGTVNALGDRRPSNEEFQNVKYRSRTGDYIDGCKDVLKRSPMDLALLVGSAEVVEVLKKYGAVAHSVKEPEVESEPTMAQGN